ncbi:hypothetical protein EW026_g2027 [Hermanssonia centrifuga]|uniref:NADP-dependent oxidoreductase domain-containing protein n=2 Tax=Hermanssonia centrifuga TaxID=98765 RepID=A0A4S4KQF7_9APHY|nr:hypothetical protein EW026_g2027 [Hermanssonia centrifuga]
MSEGKMQYVRLGNSGLKVSKIILGTMQYGNKSWQDWLLEEDEAIKHIKYAYDHGIQTFDTADVYSNGLSEKILGNAIKQLKLPREELVIMTKVYQAFPRDSAANVIVQGLNPDEIGLVNQWGLSPYLRFREGKPGATSIGLHRFIPMQVNLLSTTGIERLTIILHYQGHRFDYNTPIEETMQALHDVVKAGYVRYIGMSSCYAYQFQAMQNYAINNKLTPFISMQNHYNLVYREEEREMFPTLKMFGVGSIPWSPLARGLITRPLSKQSLRGQTDWFIDRYNKGNTTDIVNRIEEIAKKRDVSMAQIGVAWVLSKEGVTAPIVGTTNLDNLKDIIAGANVKLTEEEIKYLEEPYQPLNVIGHF